ncbi:MAG: histidine kinase N-terminal 7TM domain-containing protein [Gemmatimonadaceae bacterium]
MLQLTGYLISLAISVAIAALCWARRAAAPGAAAYAVLALSQATWTFAYVLKLTSPSLEAKRFWDDFQYIGGAGWAIAFVVFTVQYSGRRLVRPALTYGLVTLPFVALVLFALTNRWLGLIGSNPRLVPTGSGPALFYDLGPGLLAVSFYGYAVFLVCLGMLAVRHADAPPLFQWQRGLVLLGNAIPLAGTALSITVLSGSPNRDFTPLTFALGNVVVALALLRFRLFDLVPVARDVVVDTMNDAVYVLDAHDRIVELNRAARRMSVAASAGVVGRPASDVFAAWPELLTRLRSGERESSVTTVDAAGGHRHLELRVLPLRRGTRRDGGRVVIARDVTERQRAEDELHRHRNRLEELVSERTAELRTANEELRRESAEREQLEERFHQAQKLEAIGRLAGGVAHDFNNLLQAIMGNAEFLLGAPAARDAQARADLEEILTATRQAAALTQQLLAFSRRQVLKPVVLDPNDVLREMAPMIRRLVAADVELDMQLRPGVGYVMVDPSRLQQVVMNLVVNARDAMPRGGRIRIDTAEAVLGESDVRGHAAARPGRFVALRVRDTGVGMDRATRQRLFEPFFTTKEAGKGTGLGLATVHGIVEQSAGLITVESAPGRGSTFTVYLPGTDAPVATPRTVEASDERDRGAETILLVESDAPVRHLVERALREGGYRVLAAGGAEEALDVARRHAAPIDLLITNARMPGGMSGRELAARLSDSRAAMPVLYMSGLAADVLAQRGGLEPGVRLLQKPFTVDALKSAVRETLGRGS